MIDLKRTIAYALLLLPLVTTATPYYPGPQPGKAKAISGKKPQLKNKLFSSEWSTAKGLTISSITDIQSQKKYQLNSPAFIITADNQAIPSTSMVLKSPIKASQLKAQKEAAVLAKQFNGKALTCTLKDPNGGFEVIWRAILRDGSNYIRQELSIIPLKPVHITTITLLNIPVENAKVIGNVTGSPVITDTMFMAFEHPLATNKLITSKTKQVDCSFNRNSHMVQGQQYTCSSVIGFYPKDQLRRGFLYYLERERAHYYRYYLHYNSWFDLNIDRPKNRMTEAEALDSINAIGTELVKKRGVKMDGFVLDDGWDSHTQVWGFHNEFPNGFHPIAKATASYNAGVGVWLSPWGGYGRAKGNRLRSGRKAGFETNRSGFSMAGKNYGAHFKKTCLEMMKTYGVNYFKFDGMGGGNKTAGASDKMADDVNAILDMSLAIRDINQDVWINATVGTWPSPFWTRFADSIWRQGGDTGFSGVGNQREQWITYRDKLTYSRICQRGPLFPLNSLMFHGTVIGERHHPGKMPLDEQSVRNEVRAAFGCGSGLQELYITPKLLTKQMWDDIAEAAKWSRKHTDVFYDTHWIGGDPNKRQVYGWASWNPEKGIITLRNPDQKEHTFSFTLKELFELPEGVTGTYMLKAPFADQRLQDMQVASDAKTEITLKPFEVLIFEAKPLLPKNSSGTKSGDSE